MAQDSNSSNTYIISEAGINANGNVLSALVQVNESKKAGADAVKFQIYDTDELFDKSFEYYNDSKRGMFSREDHVTIANYAKEIGIEYLATPFHLWAVDLLEEIGVSRYKVASISVSDSELLQRIAETKKPVIMSVGKSNDQEISKALDILKHNQVTILYCVCKYPSTLADFDFREMSRLNKEFKTPVGFSSHCPDILASVKATSLGATVLEQHTTESRDLDGCDQSSSITYPELRKLVQTVRKLELMK